MPYKSEAQRRFFNSEAGRKMLGEKEVEKWNKESKGLELPEKVEDSLNINPNKMYYSSNPRLPKKKGFEFSGKQIIEEAKEHAYPVYLMNSRTFKKEPLSFEEYFNKMWMKNWVEAKTNDAISPDDIFEDIMLKYMPNGKKVMHEVSMVYLKHKGDPKWDKAFAEFKKQQNLDSKESCDKFDERVKTLGEEVTMVNDAPIGKMAKVAHEQLAGGKSKEEVEKYIKNRYGLDDRTLKFVMNNANSMLKGYNVEKGYSARRAERKNERANDAKNQKKKMHTFELDLIDHSPKGNPLPKKFKMQALNEEELNKKLSESYKNAKVNSIKQLDSNVEKEYKFNVKVGDSAKQIKVMAGNYNDALKKVKKEAIKFKCKKVESKFDNNKLSTRDL